MDIVPNVRTWKAPVATKADLPSAHGGLSTSAGLPCDGETRMVLDENAIYIFDEPTHAWLLLAAGKLRVGDLVKVVEELPSLGRTGLVARLANKAVIVRWPDGSENTMHESWLEKTDIITGVGGIGG